MVTVSSVGKQQDYQWQYVSRQFVPPEPINLGGLLINNRQSQTVSVRFLNDIAQSFQLRSSKSYRAEQECTVKELSAVGQQIQIGDVIADLLICWSAERAANQ